MILCKCPFNAIYTDFIKYTKYIVFFYTTYSIINVETQ